MWVRTTDGLPARLGWSDGKKAFVTVDVRNLKPEAAWAAEKWKLAANAGDKIETVALAHLTRFLQTAPSILNNQIPTLGPVTGERKLLASHGAGRLEQHDGTKVLFLKGTPEEMGAQHGTLMRAEVRNLMDRVLYGVGVGSSFSKARWFFSEIEEATGRFGKFVDPRYTREMDAMASAAGVLREEARLANYFPELFHCSGFAVFGDATTGGRIYHGRVLDYMKGIGLEQNATVIVHQPEQGHAWVNISYAGFIGSVTAMNARHISVGEMGGRGEGQWDGKPMAQLIREVMEKASTLDEAVAIMRRGPRTCEYYYVIADGKAKRAVGIAATPTKFEVVLPNQAHPQLPHPVKDAVLMSAGERYEELARRVKLGFGKLDADGARDLMTRPVCMNSNIHSVLFAPDTLDFWVANADSKNVASHTRYTHYNLKELLVGVPEDKRAAGGGQ
ncbi:MAG: C45 family autoproteolytic acyltransferase/hydrolase [Limisphaerales bacterium]